MAATMDGQEEERKFASKPNNKMKPGHPNQNFVPASETKQEETGGFSWGSLLGLALQMIVGGPVDGPGGASDKMDTLTALTRGDLSWGEMFSLGLELVLNLVRGGEINGIDRVDNGSPLEGILATIISFFTDNDDPSEVNVMAKQASELFGLVVTLLDTLKTSFSQRSLEARSLGTSDPMADAAVAATTMLKTYIRNWSIEDDLCVQKSLCQANRNCVEGTGDSGYLFCQIGTYGMSYLLEQQTYVPFEIYNDAGRRGRIGDDCYEIFSECNEI